MIGWDAFSKQGYSSGKKHLDSEHNSLMISEFQLVQIGYIPEVNDLLFHRSSRQRRLD
jgi:hypothetical protein